VHHRLAEALQVQLARAAKLIDQAREDAKVHASDAAPSGTVAAKLHGAHLAAQVALADWFDLDEARKLQRTPLVGTRSIATLIPHRHL
jgi:hypothetical protein